MKEKHILAENYERFFKDRLVEEGQGDDFKKVVLSFLEYPWQEDIEIEIVEMISEYEQEIKTSSSAFVKSYLKRFIEENDLLSARYTQSMSDKFIDALNYFENA